MKTPKKFGVWGNVEKEVFWDILPKIIIWSKNKNIELFLTEKILSDSRAGEFDQPIINSVEKIDGIFIGPNDLTTSMGIPDERESEEYINMLKKVIKISESYSIPVMIHHHTPEESKLTVDIGSRFVLHGNDSSMLSQKIAEDFTKLKNKKNSKSKDDLSDKI